MKELINELYQLVIAQHNQPDAENGVTISSERWERICANVQLLTKELHARHEINSIDDVKRLLIKDKVTFEFEDGRVIKSDEKNLNNWLISLEINERLLNENEQQNDKGTYLYNHIEIEYKNYEN